jgi:hypothetical protein
VHFDDESWRDGVYAFLAESDFGKCLFCDIVYYTGCLKKNAMEIQQAVVHHKRG